jgi:hypothetical protein
MNSWVRQLTYSIDQTTVQVNDDKLFDSGTFTSELYYYNFATTMADLINERKSTSH